MTRMVPAAMNSLMTDAETRHARKRQQRAARNRLMRARRRLGLVMRTLPLQREWLDALEERGCLDPDRRGNRVDEADAIGHSFQTLS
jgi:hypothetical protein